MKKKPGHIICLLIGWLLLMGPGLGAVTFTVNTVADTVDANPGDGMAADADGKSSLRAALMEANALFGPDTIELPAGTFTVAIEGVGEDHCQTGDLDIRSNLTLRGAGMDQTIIDGHRLDRVIHIIGNWQVSISDLTICGGRSADGATYITPANVGESGQDGGGILNGGGRLTLERCTVRDNITGDGYSWFHSGSGGFGGGICSRDGSLTVSHCLINHNRTGDGQFGEQSGGFGGFGGGIAAINGTVVVSDCLIADNSTGDGGGNDYSGGPASEGGGIYVEGVVMTLVRSTLRGNIAGKSGLFDDGTRRGGTGGAVANRGQSYLYQCTMSGNWSGEPDNDQIGRGGAVYNAPDCDLRLTNCTISGNENAAGIDNLGTATLTNCTLTGNSGGILNIDSGYFPTAPLLKMRNTITAGNQAGPAADGPDFAGELHSQGYNLIGQDQGFTVTGDQTGNIYGADPRLDLLADNGGSSRTHALLSGSPAIDAADPGYFPKTDQRGVLRPKDGSGDGTALPDIGAFELFFPQVTITSPPADSTVWGTVPIEAEANSRYVDFYIGDTFLHHSDGSPFGCHWDTLLFPNGQYRVKAKAYDVGGQQSAEDQIEVTVDNTVIQLAARRVNERSWLFRRLYGSLAFTIIHTGPVAPVTFIIERRDGEGAYRTVKEVSAADIQAGSFTYPDPLPHEDLSYTYRITARDDTGIKVGISPPQTI